MQSFYITSSTSISAEANELLQSRVDDESYLQAGEFTLCGRKDVLNHFRVNKQHFINLTGSKRFAVICSRCNWKGVGNICQLENHLFATGSIKSCTNPLKKDDNNMNDTSSGQDDPTQLQSMRKALFIRMLSTTSLTFRDVENPWFVEFVNSLGRGGPAFTIPNRLQIPSLLEEESKNQLRSVMEIISIQSKLRAITLLWDSWTNNNGHATVVVIAAVGDNHYFIEAFVDIVKRKTSEFYFDCLEKTLAIFKKFNVDTKRIYGITSDGASPCLSAGKDFSLKYNIFNMHCLVHCMNLLCDKLLSVPFFTTMLENVDHVISLFRRNSYIRGMHEKGKGKLIPAISCTRFTSVFLAIGSIKAQKYELRNLLLSPEVESYLQFCNSSAKQKIRLVSDILSDTTFNENIKFAHAYLSPLVYALRLLDSRKPIIGYVHVLFQRVCDAMTKVVIDFSQENNRFKVVAADPDKYSYEQTLLSDRNIYYFSFITNPFFHKMAQQEWMKKDGICKLHCRNILKVFAGKDIFEGDRVTFVDLEKELDEYITGTKGWISIIPDIDHYSSKCYPIEWWEINGIGNLRRICQIVHSLIPVESAAESTFSCWSHIQRPSRNKLNDETSRNLVRNSVNLKFIAKEEKEEKVTINIADVWDKKTNTVVMKNEDWAEVSNWCAELDEKKKIKEILDGGTKKRSRGNRVGECEDDDIDSDSLISTDSE